MNKYGCDDPQCSIHERRDTEKFSRISGTDISVFLGAAYVGEYLVCTGAGWSVAQQIAIKLLDRIGEISGEEKAMEAVSAMPSVSDKGITAAQLFQVEYQTEVYYVGDGVLMDIGTELSDYDAASRYVESTHSAEAARTMHSVMIENIKAGRFNGSGL